MITKITKLCLYLLAFIPLMVDYKVFFPFTSAKSLFIQTILIVSSILLLIQYFRSTAFRQELVRKTKIYIKNPLFLSVLSFFSILIISTLFAVDKYLAFWGNLSRVEGLSMMLFYLAFFLISSYFFEKKDWLIFFKLSLFTTLILLSKEFTEVFGGVPRPISFIGNPTFLAGYLLFSITSALFIMKIQGGTLNNSKKGFSLNSDIWWNYFSILMIILSIIGIFLTQTRGTILGLGLGIVIAFIYSAFKGRDINYKKLNLQKFAVALLCLGIIFSGVFVLTRKNTFWQNIPGLSRLAKTNTGDEEDPSTQIRLYVYKSSLKAINPTNNGLAKLLIGWGPENFILADSQYYFPEQYKYEQRWYDRAHNKFLDTLVMNGVLGLITYLAIIFFVFRFLFRKSLKKESFNLELLAVYFFIVSYLVHIMFVFDQISTTIPFYSILAFIIYLDLKGLTLSDPKKGQALSSTETKESNQRSQILLGSLLSVFTCFLIFVYILNTVPGYIQMRKYSIFKQHVNLSQAEDDLKTVFTPFTVPQMNIRRNLLEIANKVSGSRKDVEVDHFLTFAISSAEDYIEKRPMDFGFQATLADMYTRKGNTLKNEEYIKRGEELIRYILSFAPNRPDMKYRLALNLLVQGKEEEAFEIYESTFVGNSYILEVDRKDFESLYTNLVKYFYEARDKENLEKVADRLKANNYGNMGALEQILDYLNKTGKWPTVDFK
jgi:O-antigen ligase